MSTQELVIEVRVPLAEGIFESADVITKVRGVADDLRESLQNKIGENFAMTIETATRRAPKGSNGAAKPAATRKAKAPAAAAETHPPQH